MKRTAKPSIAKLKNDAWEDILSYVRLLLYCLLFCAIMFAWKLKHATIVGNNLFHIGELNELVVCIKPGRICATRSEKTPRQLRCNLQLVKRVDLHWLESRTVYIVGNNAVTNIGGINIATQLLQDRVDGVTLNLRQLIEKKFSVRFGVGFLTTTKNILTIGPLLTHIQKHAERMIHYGEYGYKYLTGFANNLRELTNQNCRRYGQSLVVICQNLKLILKDNFSLECRGIHTEIVDGTLTTSFPFARQEQKKMFLGCGITLT